MGPPNFGLRDLWLSASYHPRWAAANQLAALRCFVGLPTAAEIRGGVLLGNSTVSEAQRTELAQADSSYSCASQHAWLWVLSFVVFCPCMMYFSARLTEKTSAFWTIVLMTMATPVASFVFSIKSIVGPQGYAPFTPYSAVGFVIILVGVVGRGLEGKACQDGEQRPLLRQT